MVDPTNELIVELLRRIQADIGDLKVEVRETRMRIGTMETQIAQLYVQYAELSHRMDRRDDLMERAMRRLELTDASHSA